MPNIIVLTSEDELYHYGVKGMKWGVRKADYKAMTRDQRKATRQAYRKEFKESGAQDRITRATMMGTLFGGPVVGLVAGLVANNRVNKGKEAVTKHANTKVEDLTKKKEKMLEDNDRVMSKNPFSRKGPDGHHVMYWQMTDAQRANVDNQYKQKLDSIRQKARNAKSDVELHRYDEEYYRVEKQYLDVVEQDFYYYD